MPRARARALSAIAAAVVADPQIFGPTRSLDEAVAQLRALEGIGEWTAHYIAMRAMREPDAFPAADIARTFPIHYHRCASCIELLIGYKSRNLDVQAQCGCRDTPL